MSWSEEEEEGEEEEEQKEEEEKDGLQCPQLIRLQLVRKYRRPHV